jgi:hypothetical protein
MTVALERSASSNTDDTGKRIDKRLSRESQSGIIFDM